MASDYVFDRTLNRYLHGKTGAIVHWGQHGPVHYSYDLRTQAARFIIVAMHHDPRDGSTDVEVLARGLIEAGGRAPPRAVFDRPPQGEVVLRAAAAMVESFELTRAELLKVGPYL